ncbi:unnamed protein product [Bemisia tabaci]|uniref:Uncharacterized protein n=1 Tax=Bemisia tabaci TaxID=7038 RepID=A0A9P0AA58_BEMTA|nr:unnamed protein product [Bemisia tabaci]
MIFTFLTIHILYLTACLNAANVVMYANKDFKDPKCDISLQGCKAICPNVAGKVTSIKPSKGACMRFFSTPDCKGGPPVYKAAYTDKDGTGLSDLTGSIFQTAKGIGDCDISNGIPQNSLGFFSEKHFKGKSCVVPVSGCKALNQDLAGKSQSFIMNSKCCTVYENKNCSGPGIITFLATDFGTAYDDYSGSPDWANYKTISSVGDSCKITEGKQRERV